MGHERLGLLPRSKRWRQLVGEIEAASAGGAEQRVPEIADRTLDQARSSFERFASDRGVEAAFRFLLTLALASRSSDHLARLRAFGVSPDDQPSPIQLARAVQACVKGSGGSPEYGHLAEAAATDAVAAWMRKHESQQRLFSHGGDAWVEASSPGGFSEISRLFFAKVTERHLRYFLERELSSALGRIGARDQFDRALTAHLDDISKHAFETSKLTQSFAAGWYTKTARKGGPTEKEVRGFLSVAFGKIRAELAREANR